MDTMKNEKSEIFDGYKSNINRLYWHIQKVGTKTRDTGPILWVRPGTGDPRP